MPSVSRARITPRTRRADAVAAVNAVRRIVRALRLQAGKTLAGAGLSAAQLFVLEQLADKPAASLGELAERTLTDRSSVAAVVDRLLAQGLVTRSRAAADRRRLTIAITPAGRDVLRRAPRSPTSALILALDSLPRPRLHAVAGALAELERAMGLADAPAGMLFDDEGGGPGRA